jgi:hypothetical protein
VLSFSIEGSDFLFFPIFNCFSSKTKQSFTPVTLTLIYQLTIINDHGNILLNVTVDLAAGLQRSVRFAGSN